jgi:hypothetical protein
MRQSLKHHFAPRWVILIYLMSVLEAVGLAAYFRAGLTDPEMASMQPLYVDTQQAPARASAQPDWGKCLLLARSAHHAGVEGKQAGQAVSVWQR